MSHGLPGVLPRRDAEKGVADWGGGGGDAEAAADAESAGRGGGGDGTLFGLCDGSARSAGALAAAASLIVRKPAALSRSALRRLGEWRSAACACDAGT